MILHIGNIMIMSQTVAFQALFPLQYQRKNILWSFLYKHNFTSAAFLLYKGYNFYLSAHWLNILLRLI